MRGKWSLLWFTVFSGVALGPTSLLAQSNIPPLFPRSVDPDSPTPNQPGVPLKPHVLETLFQEKIDLPLGFTGRSGILPTEGPSLDGHFVPVVDRWRVGFPEWDRGGKDHPWYQEYPYDLGQWWDPYRQNILKSDYPIFGQNTFLDLTITSFTVVQPSTVPSQTTPFESTARYPTIHLDGNRPLSWGYLFSPGGLAIQTDPHIQCEYPYHRGTRPGEPECPQWNPAGTILHGP